MKNLVSGESESDIREQTLNLKIFFCDAKESAASSMPEILSQTAVTYTHYS